MTDIYDIKGILLGLPFNINYSLLYILFIIGLFILYKHIYVTKKPIINEIIKKEVVKKVDYNKLLQKLEEKYIKNKSDIFYGKLIYILREILEYKGNINISMMTYSQINKLDIDENLKILIKSIYYKEYKKNIDDSLELRIGYIDKIKKLINN